MRINKAQKVGLLLLLLSISVAVLAASFLMKKNGFSGNKTALPDAKLELTTLMQKFAPKDGKMQVTGSIDLYDGDSLETIKEHNNFLFVRNGAGFYSELSYQQTMCNGKFIVQLDTVNRYLIVSKLNDSTIRAAQNPIMPFVDIINSDTATFPINVTVSENDGQRMLTVVNTAMPEIKSYKIMYDPIKYTITGTEIEWWKDNGNLNKAKNNKIWLTKISYRQQEFKMPDVDSMVNKMISIKKEGIQIVNEDYKDYRLMANGFN